MGKSSRHFEQLKQATRDLFEYCRAANWAGYDPYDALNSRLIKALPFLNSRWPRLVLTQSLKRLPFNLRPWLLVPRKPNPKGHALFLQAVLQLKESGLVSEEALTSELAGEIEAMRSPGKYCCWGYSFPWQTRNVLVPAGSPNLVCTVFVASALLDLFEAGGDAKYFEFARSAAEYIIAELFWTGENGVAAFRYPFPTSAVPVHNANFLAAAFLARIWKHTGEGRFREPALKTARYSASRQLADGSWLYGEAATQNWIDNFHTGYNLCALAQLGQTLESDEFKAALERGYQFYLNRFFRADGAPKYFHDRDYPIDVHCVAGSIITLGELRHLDRRSMELAEGVCFWALEHLRGKKGCFYHQQLRFGRNKIPYMRWGQAWMLLALASFLRHSVKNRAVSESSLTEPVLAG